jgi:putative MATE family efflux protein
MTENTSKGAPEGPPLEARRHGRDLTTGSIPRHLVIFSLPMLVGGAFQTAYSFINRYWVGQFLGSDSMAAVTLSIPVVFVLMALGAGLTMATSILISQHYGARDMPAVRRVVDSSTLLVAGLSLVLLAAGEVLTPAILRAMNTPPDVLPLAVDYMRIFLLSMPLGFGLFLTRSMLQGIGDSTTPLYFLGVSVALNAGLDPVLMFGWLGAPKLGLNGTAWATLIAQGLALAALVAWLRRRKNPVAPELAWRCFDWPTAWTTIRIGLPTAAQHSLISVGMAFVTGIINGFGKLATAAFGAASCIDQIAFLPALTFSMAIATLAGQNIGAGRYDRIRQIVLWGCLLSGGITLAASVLVVSIPRLLLRIFTPEAAVLDIGVGYLRIVGSCYIFFAIMFVTNGIINGSGHTLVTTFISLLSLWVIRVPVADWLSRRMNSIDGVWYAMAGSFGVSMVVSFAYYLTGHWRRPVARRPAIPPGPASTFGEETGEV